MNKLTLALAAATLAAPLALPTVAQASIVTPTAAPAHAAPSALQDVYWRRYGYWYAGHWRYQHRYWGYRRWYNNRWYYR